MIIRKLFTFILFLLPCINAVGYSFPLQDERIIIAIVDFRNTSADDELDYLEQTIPESITTTMARGGRLEIVERGRLSDALKEMEMSEFGIVDESQAAEIGRAVGANAILVGSFVSIGGTLQINARLIDVETSRIIKAETVRGQVGPQIFDLMDQMAISMESQLLGEPVPTTAQSESSTSPLSGQRETREVSGADGGQYELRQDEGDDTYEPNDAISNAYDLSNSETVWLSGIGGYGIQRDDDWYKIAVDPGYEQVNIFCEFSHSQGDIDIALHNQSGTELASSTSTTDNEYISYNVSSSGTYYIRVFYANNGNQYDLWWNDGDDAYEPNNSMSNAYNLSNFRTTWLSSIAGFGIQRDDDWYRISVNPDYEQINISCTFSHSLGDIDISLHNQSGSELASSTSTSDNEYLSYNTSSSGTYYIRVYYANNGNQYDLWWSNGDDAYEPNNTMSRAYDLSNYETTWLSSIGGYGTQRDDDWYMISVDPGYEQVNISCTFSHSLGDIDISLHNQSGTELTSSTSTTDDEYISYNVSSSGTYYIRVYYADNGNQYDLWWDDTE